MNVYIPLGILLVLLCYIYRGNIKVFGFSLLPFLLFAAFRYNMGEDYLHYLTKYELAQEYGYMGYFRYVASSSEPLFVLLLANVPSYFLFIGCLSILWFVLIFFFFKKFLNYNYLFLGLFFLLFDDHNVIQNLVALRSSCVCILFLIAIFFLLKKKVLVYSLLVIIAIGFHSSALLLLVFVLFSEHFGSFFDRFISSKFSIVLLTCILLLFSWAFKEYAYSYVSQFMHSVFPTFERYDQYFDMYGKNSYSIGSLLYVIIQGYVFYSLCVSLQYEENEEFKVLYRISIFVLFFNFLLGSLMVRYLMYVGPILIVCYIRTIARYHNNLLLSSLLVLTIFNFMSLLRASWFSTLLYYRTIFESQIIL